MNKTIRIHINDAVSELEEIQNGNLHITDVEVYVDSALESLEKAISQLDDIESNVNEIESIAKELSKQTY